MLSVNGGVVMQLLLSTLVVSLQVSTYCTELLLPTLTISNCHLLAFHIYICSASWQFVHAFYCMTVALYVADSLPLLMSYMWYDLSQTDWTFMNWTCLALSSFGTSTGIVSHIKCSTKAYRPFPHLRYPKEWRHSETVKRLLANCIKIRILCRNNGHLLSRVMRFVHSTKGDFLKFHNDRPHNRGRKQSIVFTVPPSLYFPFNHWPYMQCSQLKNKFQCVGFTKHRCTYSHKSDALNREHSAISTNFERL